jgi:excisionase family DNA binding protein
MSEQSEQKRTLVEVLDPSRVSSGVAADHAAKLRNRRSQLLVRTPGGKTVRLDAAVARAVAAMLEEAAEGRAVAIVSESDELTTAAAAALLGCSRPHVAKLIDTGVIKGRRVGTHRRVRITDLMEYKRSVERRHQLLDSIVMENEEMGLYEAE